MRYKKPQLNFASEKQKQKKRMHIFIVSFAVFVFVLGGASVLLFMDYMEYDFSNFGQESTEEQIETTLEDSAQDTPIELKTIHVLLTFYNQKKELTDLYLISLLSDKNPKITVQAMDIQEKVQGESLQDCFKNKGMNGLKTAVEAQNALHVDRYIKQSEVELKKTVNRIGNVVVNVPSSIHCNQKGLTLYLEAGPQNLTGDLFLKYLYYAKTPEKEMAIVNFIQTTLHALYKSQDNQRLLNDLFNAVETDFSILDNANDGYIPMFIYLRDAVQPVR